MTNKAEEKQLDVFEELDKYNTIIAYSDGSKDLSIFEKNAGCSKTYVDLRVSEELRGKFVEHYGVEKLPCMIKFGCKVYMDENLEKALLKAREREDQYYRRLANDLVSSADVFIFIKGRASAPRCKFTRQLLGIFDEQRLVYGKDFLDFDVLADHVLRERLKALHSWPTFPQIFVRGKFLGGIDALKAAIENGVFRKMLNGEDV